MSLFQIRAKPEPTFLPLQNTDLDLKSQVDLLRFKEDLRDDTPSGTLAVTPTISDDAHLECSLSMFSCCRNKKK